MSPPLPNLTARNLRKRAENFLTLARSVKGDGTRMILQKRAADLIRQAERIEATQRKPESPRAE